MNIAWLINVPLPEASILLNEEPTPYGGWLIETAGKLAIEKGINLSIIFPHKKSKEKTVLTGKNITYYPFNPVSINTVDSVENRRVFDGILRRIKPDLVHIHGTEIPHSNLMIKLCEENSIKNVISIQGLTSYIAKHTYSNLPQRVVRGATFRNFILRDNVYNMKRKYLKLGELEKDTLRRTRHIIGRTTWDKACTSHINSKAQYYKCNETLRSEFYKEDWNFENIEENSIFISQSQNPIKGLHSVLEAMPLILKRFPNTKIYVAGKNIIKSDNFFDRLTLTYYGKYIKKLIKKYQLEGNIEFLGLLSEREMCNQYLKSNVFISASYIENSPNSLGEAMILGVPSVASGVGGVQDMMTHEKEGFVYQADAPYMMAHYVCEIFDNVGLAKEFSNNAKNRAKMTHDKKLNYGKLIHIYKSILFD